MKVYRSTVRRYVPSEMEPDGFVPHAETTFDVRAEGFDEAARKVRRLARKVFGPGTRFERAREPGKAAYEIVDLHVLCWRVE